MCEEMQEREKVMRNMVKENAYMRFLGIEFLELSQECAVSRMKYKEELANPYGMFHGGPVLAGGYHSRDGRLYGRALCDHRIGKYELYAPSGRDRICIL